MENPRWLRFRRWLFTASPRWFYNAYIKYGERFARFIADKPAIKAVIRRWMDSRVAQLPAPSWPVSALA